MEGPETAPDADQEPDQEQEPGQAEKTAAEPVDRGPIIIFVAFIAIVIAVGAIGAVLWGAAFGSEEPPPTTAALQAAEADETVENLPIAGSMTITYPTLGQVTRYEQDGGIVYLHATGDFCGRGAGTIEARGTITNASWLQRTYDYVIQVELIRAWNRAPIGFLETTVEGLSSGQSADWSVDIVSSRVSTVDCEIASVTVLPAGS